MCFLFVVVAECFVNIVAMQMRLFFVAGYQTQIKITSLSFSGLQGFPFSFAGSHVSAIKHKQWQHSKLLNTDQSTIVLKEMFNLQSLLNAKQLSQMKPISGSFFSLHGRKNKAG